MRKWWCAVLAATLGLFTSHFHTNVEYVVRDDSCGFPEVCPHSCSYYHIEYSISRRCTSITHITYHVCVRTKPHSLARFGDLLVIMVSGVLIDVCLTCARPVPLCTLIPYKSCIKDTPSVRRPCGVRSIWPLYHVYECEGVIWLLHFFSKSNRPLTSEL